MASNFQLVPTNLVGYSDDEMSSEQESSEDDSQLIYYFGPSGSSSSEEEMEELEQLQQASSDEGRGGDTIEGHETTYGCGSTLCSSSSSSETSSSSSSESGSSSSSSEEEMEELEQLQQASSDEGRGGDTIEGHETKQNNKTTKQKHQDVDQEKEDDQMDNYTTQAQKADENTVPNSLQTPAVSPRSSVPCRKYALNFRELPEPMQKFLREVESFFTKPVNLERQKLPIKESTYHKAQERMLCFLGFAKHERGMDVQPALFLRSKVIEEYLTYVKEQRQCSSATMSNHAASLLYPVKFLHREKAPEYKDILVVKQIRRQVAELQKLGNRERLSSKEDLEAVNRWLDWDQIVQAVSQQQERYEIARTFSAKATECANLLILGLYVLIPPSRGQEIRTLEIVPYTENVSSPDLGHKNLVQLAEDGTVTLRFQDYKTKATYGSDTTVLQNDHELSYFIKEYIQKYRRQLVTSAESGEFLLLNSKGVRYSSAGFSSHVKELFYRLTGVKITINVLRSSFLTWAYGNKNCDETMKDSLAKALRHTRKQAQSTYDRRTANERKQPALSLTAEFANATLRAARETGAERKKDGRVAPSTSFDLGDFVGLVESESTLKCPKVLVGRIQSLLGDNRAVLLWYKLIAGDKYTFQFEDDCWIESCDALVPVQMKPVKRSPGVFKLDCQLRTIHRAVKSNK